MLLNNDKNSVDKLIILYVLNKMEIPLSNNQLTNIILENNAIDFFNLPQCFSELEQSDLIQFVQNQQKSFYQITENGTKTALILNEKIPFPIKNRLDAYIAGNKDKIKKEAQITADFVKISEKEYIVHLKVIENEMVLIDLKLNVVSAKQAKFICEKWKNSSGKIYRLIMDTLIN